MGVLGHVWLQKKSKAEELKFEDGGLSKGSKEAIGIKN